VVDGTVTVECIAEGYSIASKVTLAPASRVSEVVPRPQVGLQHWQRRSWIQRFLWINNQISAASRLPRGHSSDIFNNWCIPQRCRSVYVDKWAIKVTLVHSHRRAFTRHDSDSICTAGDVIMMTSH